MPNDIRFYTEVLKSDECVCERPKKYKFAFCYNCFKELPDELQKRLYKRIRDGFEEAYDDAIKYLTGEGLI